MKILLIALIAGLLLLGCTSTQPTASPSAAASVASISAPTAAVTASPQPSSTTSPTTSTTASPAATVTSEVTASPTTQGGPRVIEVVGTTNGGTKWEWMPSTITVKKGEKVKFSVNVPAGDVPHGFFIPEFGINAKLAPGETVETSEFTPQKAGTFPFSCSVFCGAGHRGMVGQLVVTE